MSEEKTKPLFEFKIVESLRKEYDRLYDLLIRAEQYLDHLPTCRMPNHQDYGPQYCDCRCKNVLAEIKEEKERKEKRDSYATTRRSS